MSASHAYSGITANNPVKTVDNSIVQSYKQCAAFAICHALLWVNEWQLASNVRLRLVEGDDQYYAIVLYKTEIVRYYENEMFSVDNGGYNTPTTAKRINQFTPRDYSFFHHNKKLAGCGSNECTHDHRMPVQK